jgi:hypothetical protein
MAKKNYPLKTPLPTLSTYSIEGYAERELEDLCFIAGLIIERRGNA